LHQQSESSSARSSRSARIQAFRAFQRASPDDRRRMRQGEKLKAVHLLSAEEVKSLFEDIVHGLGFLVNGSFPPLVYKVLNDVLLA
jgi:hypothetical protein